MPDYRKVFRSAFILPALLLLLCQPLMAQEVGTPQPAPKNSLVDGSWSMQFRIVNDFQLSSFEGALISAKRHYSDRSALRIGLGAGLRNRSVDFDVTTREQNEDAFNIEINSQYIYYPAPGAEVNFYLGFGPHFSHIRTNSDETNESTKSENHKRETAIGAIASWGVEWFVAKNISFICEYGAGLRYTHETVESMTNEITVSNITDNEFRFFSSNVDFGLSVYF